MPERIPGRTYAELGLSLPGKAKTLSPDMQAWITGLDVPDSDQGAKLVSPYMQSTWIYTAVSVMAENLAQIPFRISQVGTDKARRIRAVRGSANPRHREFCRRELGENIVESGDVVDLFNKPHPTMDRILFWSQVVSWDALRGEFFIVPLDEADGVVDLAERAPRVRRLLTLDTVMFWHVVTGYELTAWRYTGNPLISPLPSEVLAPTEVIHCRNVNPYLYWRGMSPLLVAMLPAAADYAGGMFMKGLLMNNADTGVIATTEQPLTKEQRDQFVAALRERKRKAGTPDRPLFLSSGVKIEKPTISNVDMQFLETRKFSATEIAAIFKVPVTLLGFSEAKASALSGGGNAIAEDKLTFVQSNLSPKCHRYEAAVDPIIKTFGEGLVGWFDLESLPVMQDARRARVDTASKVFAMGVPLNDINEVYDLGFPQYPWGNEGLLPFNLAPARQVVAGPEEPSEDTPPTESTEEDEDNEETPEETPTAGMRRLLANIQHPTSNIQHPIRTPNTAELWRRHVRARAGTVKLFQRKIEKVLNEFRGKALAKLDELHLGKSTVHGPQSTVQRGLVDLIFSPHEFGNALKLVLTQPITGALQQAGDEARREVGLTDPWKMPPPFVKEFMAERDQKIMGVGGTVREQLNTSLEEGYDAGETTAELAGRVKAMFNNLTGKEALRVARTETNIAFNAARHEALDDAGIQYKAWLSSHGPNVRPGHEAAEDTYIDDPIPLDEPFIVDLDGDAERLMYPGDSSLGASPGNTINCQCVQLAAQRQEEDEKGVWFLIFGFGRMHFASRDYSDEKGLKHHCETSNNQHPTSNIE